MRQLPLWFVKSCEECGGHCCLVIAMPPKYLLDENRALLPTFWSRISVWQARRWRPWLEKTIIDTNTALFTCLELDRETGLCKVYEDRPKVCSGYPFYEKPPHDIGYWSVPFCVFRGMVLMGKIDPLPTP